MTSTQEDSGKHVPYGEKGHYGETYADVFPIGEVELEFVDAAVLRSLQNRKLSNISGKEPFYVADFGTADAAIAIPVMKKIIARVREKEGPTTPVVVVFEDQPNNDWHTVFEKGELLTSDANVFCLGSGTSFYKPCLPPGTLDLAFSSIAMHWMTRVPCSIPDTVHISCTKDSTARQAFDQQAGDDYEQFCRLRSVELRPGGQMVCVTFGVDDEGRCFGRTDAKANFWEVWSSIWAEIASEDEVLATNFPQYYRTMEEWKSPFENGKLPTMRWVSGRHISVPCPLVEGYKGNIPGYPYAGDPEGHGRHFAEIYRPFSNSIMLNGLNDADPSTREQRVDKFYARLGEEVGKAPLDHNCGEVLTVIATERRL